MLARSGAAPLPIFRHSFETSARPPRRVKATTTWSRFTPTFLFRSAHTIAEGVQRLQWLVIVYVIGNVTGSSPQAVPGLIRVLPEVRRRSSLHTIGSPSEMLSIWLGADLARQRPFDTSAK